MAAGKGFEFDSPEEMTPERMDQAMVDIAAEVEPQA